MRWYRKYCSDAHVVIDIDGKYDKKGNFEITGDTEIKEYRTKEIAEAEALILWQSLTNKEQKERRIIAGLVHKYVDDGCINYWEDDFLIEYAVYEPKPALKNDYYIGNFEGFDVIYCEETKSFILDNEGDPVASEEYDITEMFDIDEEELLKMSDLHLASQKELENLMNYSSGFKFWIEAKEV